MADKYERALNVICHMTLTELQERFRFDTHAPSEYGITASDFADQILYEENKNKIKALIEEIGTNDFFDITKEIWDNEYN